MSEPFSQLRMSMNTALLIFAGTAPAQIIHAMKRSTPSGAMISRPVKESPKGFVSSSPQRIDDRSKVCTGVCEGGIATSGAVGMVPFGPMPMLLYIIPP